ncbi:WD40/YVTN/BNR-like repeat-containing protein [Sphingomonas adhaesiva]|uniref:WD40/YVTN/BNR-like repeat-containing protein n=1 Tax=Sphingomonas adhaesiva TaxID=28212 RepID=UPI002FF541D8
MMMTRQTIALLLAGTLLAGQGLAPAAWAAPAVKSRAPAEAARKAEASRFAGMQYRLIGPFRGGRVSAVAGVVQKPDTYYMGASGGGVWRTDDGGNSWKPLWDKLPEASPSIGAMAVAPSDPKTIYVGTGEANIRGNVITGNGVYKSTDEGKTWTFAGLRDTMAIGRMVVHPTDPDTVFVAALGHPFGDNAERGVFRTRDGGKTWQRVLFVDDRTGAIDVQMEPGNPNVLWAGMWQAHRKPWIMESGGPGSGLYRSTDGGETWQKQTGRGLPEGLLGRIGVAPTPDPKRVYALIEAKEGGLFRTDDGGASWQRISDRGDFRQRAWYYTHVIADPKDADKVYVLNTGAYKSTDAGKTFKTMPTFHGDNHALWINPTDTDRMVEGNDGAANVSVNGGASWTTGANQATAQFYHISVDKQVPYRIYGAQQDNTTVSIASGNTRGPIGQESFWAVGGGESGYVVADPKNPDVVIANSYGNQVTRYDHKTGQLYAIGPFPREAMGWAAKDLEHRPQWTEPLLYSPHDPNVLYNATEVLWKTTDEGKSWKQISPDLTRNDKSKQLSSGGPLTKDNTGVEYYNTIFSVNESPVQKDLLWVGTDDGLIHLTRDGGGSWQNVTPRAMPEWATVNMVEPDPRKPGTMYVAADRHRLDDFAPYGFRTDDFGKTWTSITAGLPADAYLHVFRADPARPGLLYAGTENGVFVSFDSGARWEPFQMALPRSPVHDLAVAGAGDLAVATHGRSFWVLDDLSAVRQWSPEIARKPFHLFAPRDTMRILYEGRGTSMGGPTAANPPQGVILYYYLKEGEAETKAEPGAAKGIDPAPQQAPSAAKAIVTPAVARKKPDDRLKLEIVDASGRVIRTYPSPHQAVPDEGEEEEGARSRKPAGLTRHAGVNRFVWDFREEAAVAVPKASVWHAMRGGPTVVPGTYTARLTVDGKTQSQTIRVLPNPNLSVTQAELQQQYDLVAAINRELALVNTAVLELRALHRQLGEARTASRDPQVTAAADAVEAKAVAVEDVLIQVKNVASQDPLNYPIRLNNMLASLATTVAQGDTAPAQQHREEFAKLKAVADTQLGAWSRIKQEDVAALNDVLRRQKLAPVTLAAEAQLAADRAAQLASAVPEYEAVGAETN